MSAINQEPVLQAPGNVIHVEWDDNIPHYANQVKNLLQNGDMLMVNYHAPIVYRWDKDSRRFMKMDLEVDYKWNHVGLGFNPIRSLIDGSIQAFYVKASDLHYAMGECGQGNGCTFYLKCENEWFTVNYDDARVFIKNNGAPLKSLYNVVTHNMVSIDHDYSWDYVFKSGESNPWLGWNTLEPSDIDVDLMMEDEEQVRKQEDNQENQTSEGEYTPSVVGESVKDESVKDESVKDASVKDESEKENFNEYDNYDDYDERREDVDGGWYTRRQFYDYYGSDEAWDNLDPSVYHQKRYDDHYNCWVTEEECYQHYGTYRVWKRMHPVKVMMRKAIWDAYTMSRYIPPELRRDFIKSILQTYE